MEEEEEARGLLSGGPAEAGGDAPAPGALRALCDPSRLAHRLLVLLLMCFLGFGELSAGRAGRAMRKPVTVPFGALGSAHTGPRASARLLGQLRAPFKPGIPKGGRRTELGVPLPAPSPREAPEASSSLPGAVGPRNL